jgi:hypothetical protein
MQVEKLPQDDWKLDKIELEFKSYGEDQGKYVGKIRFQNGEYESFSFKIRPDMAQPYIELIGADIVKCAESLGARLAESLGLKK